MEISDNSLRYKVFFIDIETTRVLQVVTVDAYSEDEAEIIAESFFNYEQFEDIDFECEVKLLAENEREPDIP